MDLQAILDFFRAVSWQLVIIVAFVVLIIYRGPIGELIPKIRRGEISRDKEKGLTFSLETAGNEPQPTETDKKINNIKQEETLETKNGDLNDTKSERNWLYLAIVENKYEDARTILLSEIKEEEDPAEIMYKRIQAADFLSRYDYRSGVIELKELITENPDRIQTYRVLINVYYRNGLYDDTRILIDQYPSNEGKFELCLHEAELLKGINEIEKALEIIENICNQDIGFKVRAKALLLKGEILNTQKKQKEAQSAYLAAYKQDPTNTFVLTKVANFFSAIGEPKIELFFRHKLITIDKNDTEYWGYLGNTRLLLNLNNLAMDAYYKANELSNGTAEWIIGNIGNLYNNVGLFSLSIENFLKSIELNPSSQYSHERLAIAYKNKEEQTKTETDIITSVKQLLAKEDENQESSLQETES